MKRKHQSRRWWLIVLLCCISLASQAATVNISGYTSVGEIEGYPLYQVSSADIVVSSSAGNFDYVIIDGVQIDHNTSSYWTSYTVDIFSYMDGQPHKLQLKCGSSDYGTCYFRILYVNGLFYSVADGAAAVIRAVKTIESAAIPSEYEYEGVSYPVRSIGPSAFINCTSLINVVIPESVETIGTSAFSGCASLASVVIPESVKTIGLWAFHGCSSLAFLTFNAANCKSCGSPNFPAFPSTISNLVLGENVTTIPSYFLYSGSAIESLTIPESVETIGDSAFSGCTLLTSLAFNAANCESCGSSSYPAFPSTISNLILGEKVTTIPSYFLYSGSAIESLTIPNSVTSIGAYAFFVCRALKSVTFGSGVISINDLSFRGCSIKKAFWLGNTPPDGAGYVNAAVNYVANDRYSFENTIVYQFLSSRFTVDGIIYVPVSPSDRTCDVVDCVYGGEHTEAVISDKVSNRGIEMKVQNISQYSFYGLTKLTQVSISDSVSSLGQYAFSDCRALEAVSIGSGVPALPLRVFSGCSALSSLTIPSNIKSIGDYAFYGCCSLADVTFEDSQEEPIVNDDYLKLGSNGSNPLFSDCPLDEVYIGRKLSYNTSSYYGNSPFYRNTTLRTVEITDAETQIYDNEFYGCSNLQSLKIGNGVTSIGSWAFSGCSSLDYFSAGFHVETIGAEAFSDCTGLTKYYSYSVNPPVCGDQALDDINKWDCTLYVPANSNDDYRVAPQWKEFFFIEEIEAVLVAEIRLNVSEVSMVDNDTFQLSAEVLPSNATDQSVIWESSDPSVVSVDESGLLQAVSEGSATITVRSADGNCEASCQVTVMQSSGVDSVIVDADADIEVFNLNGIKISDSLEGLSAGLYIIRQGVKVQKIMVK